MWEDHRDENPEKRNKRDIKNENERMKHGITYLKNS